MHLTRMQDLPVVCYVFPPLKPTCPFRSPVFPPFGATPRWVMVAFTPPFESSRALQPLQIFPYLRVSQVWQRNSCDQLSKSYINSLNWFHSLFVVRWLVVFCHVTEHALGHWFANFFSCRHSFSEDIWVKFSNLSEDKIIGTYDSTAHVSRCGALDVLSTCLIMAQPLKFAESLELYTLRKWSRNWLS